ncbi:hypothetical protein ACFL1H_06115 [Nanoarchaeota archaeon]
MATIDNIFGKFIDIKKRIKDYIAIHKGFEECYMCKEFKYDPKGKYQTRYSRSHEFPNGITETRPYKVCEDCADLSYSFENFKKDTSFDEYVKSEYVKHGWRMIEQQEFALEN